MQTIIMAIFLSLFSFSAIGQEKLIIEEYLCETSREGQIGEDGSQNNTFRNDNVPILSARLIIHHLDDVRDSVYVDFISTYPEEHKYPKNYGFDLARITFTINFDYVYFTKKNFIEHGNDFTAHFGDLMVMVKSHDWINISRMRVHKTDYLFMKCTEL